MKLLLAGGGTGGHLFPAVALADRLMQQDPEASVLFVGTAKGLEARMIPTLGYPLELVDIQGVAGRGVLAKLLLLPRVIKSVGQAKKILKSFQPDVVVGVGGYASAPVLLAARFMGVPYLIHEQNAQAGMTNRLLGGGAQAVCLSFSGSGDGFPADRSHLTGNPLRKGMEDCPEDLAQESCLLVFGGSQGARAINNAMCEALPLMDDMRSRLTIVHQTGEADLEKVRAVYKEHGWEGAMVLPFIDDMAGAYERANLVLCRAGATTLAELTVCGRPAVLVPLPHAANDHQTANAQALEKAGAAHLLPQSEMTPHNLACVLMNHMKDRPLLTQMAAAARTLGQRGAADSILALCRQIAGKA